MRRIRAEMDRVGNSMTLIGRHEDATITGPRRREPGLEAESTPESAPADVMQMSRAYRRLEALYKASQVMSSSFDLNTRLSEVLDLVIAVLGAERGFVMLREDRTQNLVVKVAREMGKQLEASSPSMGIAGRSAIDGEPVLMVDRATDQEFGMRDSIIMSQIVSAMCVPLKIENRVLGSIYVDTRKQRAAFNEEDLELFSSLANQSAFAVDNVRLHEQVVEAEKKRLNFSRFLPNAIVDKIMSEDTAIELGGQKARVTTLFCDIRGSSQLAERLSPQEMVELLNAHFTAMTEIIFNWRGTLDKYIGDEIMAVFGAPISTGDDAYAAVCAALDLQRVNQELNVGRRRDGQPEIQVGIGIDTGEVVAGYIGSPMRMDYTVVGDRVNTAKRFCDMAAAGKVVVGQETWEEIEDRVAGVPIGNVRLKGKEQAVLAHEIVSLK
jgi:adenylate cyclase